MIDYRISELSQQVMTARANYRPIRIIGADSKGFYGNPMRSSDDAVHVLDMRDLSGILMYEPSELVIRALAGTTVQELETVLAEHGQMLAFDPPRFHPESTIGGVFASGLSGPLGFGYGPLRHYVLGARLLDAQGRLLRFGGEVMKNVAGYDVSRLLAGSMGMFGAVVDVSLKVMPIPEVDRSLVFCLGQEQALEICRQFRSSAMPVKAAAWMADPRLEGMNDCGPALVIRLAGSKAAVDHARKRLGGQQLTTDVAQAWWTALKDQTHAFFSGRPLWRLAVSHATGPLPYETGCFDWAGEIRWVVCDDTPEAIRDVAEGAGGHATLFRYADVSQIPADGVFHPLSSPVRSVVRRLKDEFDPKGIFNPGRFVVDL